MELLHAHPVAILVSVAAVVVALAFYFNWKRGKDLEAMAAAMGLRFSSDGPDTGALEGTGLDLFKQGRARKAYNLIEMSARPGLIRFFDYKYRSGTGKNSHTHNFTVALLSCACDVPFFDLKPETLMYKIGEAVGFKDIDLPAFPLFSDKYRLTGPEETSVHMFFTPGRAAWFERHLGLRVQGAPGSVLLVRAEGRLPAGAWPAFIEEAKALAGEILT